MNKYNHVIERFAIKLGVEPKTLAALIGVAIGAIIGYITAPILFSLFIK